MAVAIEFGALVMLAATGWFLLPATAGDRWRLVAALPLGVALYAAVMVVLLATRLPIAWPWVGLLVALVLALALARRRRAGVARTSVADARPAGDRRWLAAGGLAALAMVVLSAVLPVVNVTSDSFRYLTVARLLATDGDASGMSAFLLQSRSLVVGAVHGLAAPDPGYLRAFSPLVALATLGVLWLLVEEGTRRLDHDTTMWVALAAVTLLATNHRFLFNAFYINGHALFAVWLLLLAGWVWRLWRRSTTARPASDSGLVGQPTSDLAVAPVQPWLLGLVASAVVVVRPEGVLVAGMALVPLVVARRVPVSWRRPALVGLGGAAVAWHGALLMPKATSDGYGPPDSMTGLAALGVAVLLVAAVLPHLDRWFGRRALVVAHGLAWVAVAVFSLREPSVLVRAAGSTLRNVLSEGAWGSSLIVLAILLVVAVALRRVAAEGALLFPLFTFVPLAILLAYLRGGSGYRVGPGDSLNRMLLHILPLAVLALALTADGEPRRNRAAAREDRAQPTG